MTIGLLILYRAQLQKAEARGYDRAKVEEQAERQKWRNTYDQRRAEIERRDSANRHGYDQTVAPIRERIIVEAARPGAFRLSDDAERLLQEQREAANRAIAAASGISLPAPAKSSEGDATGSAGKQAD